MTSPNRSTQPTHPRDLGALAIGFGLFSWLIVHRYYGSLPSLRWYVPISLAILGVAELISGFQLRARIRRRPGVAPIDPLVAARQLALAKASALVGAAMLGAWAGLVLYLVPRLSTLAAAGADTLTGTLGVASSALLVGAALWLEYCCRTPKPPDSADRDSDERRSA
jgi:Protein of unknown function (DUF3180)